MRSAERSMGRFTCFPPMAGGPWSRPPCSRWRSWRASRRHGPGWSWAMGRSATPRRSPAGSGPLRCRLRACRPQRRCSLPSWNARARAAPSRTRPPRSPCMDVLRKRRRDGRRATAVRCPIRPARLADVGDVGAIERAVFSDPWSASDFTECVTSGVPFLVAERRGVVAGYVVARWQSACSRSSPGAASARRTSRCGRRTRRPGSCMSHSGSARSRAGRGTIGGRSRTRWFYGLPLAQRGGLQNFSTSGVSLIDRITCGSYTVVALGPDPPSVWRSVVSRSLNKVMLIGNLGADPEVRSTNNGSRVATLSLATSRQWTGQGGEKQEKTEWHRVICWNNKGAQLADLAEKYMKKGDRIYIEGRIEYRTWEDREEQTRYTTEIIAREVILLSSRGGGEGSGEFARAKAAAKVAPEGGGKAESLDAFPEALDEEDDDLPF